MDNNNWIVDQQIFKHPFTCTISGPTQSGKTWLIKKILSFNATLFDKPPQKIIYCYSTWQKNFET
jgi:predicted AAA+ superfamily ATPase